MYVELISFFSYNVWFPVTQHHWTWRICVGILSITVAFMIHIVLLVGCGTFCHEILAKTRGNCFWRLIISKCVCKQILFNQVPFPLSVCNQLLKATITGFRPFGTFVFDSLRWSGRRRGHRRHNWQRNPGILYDSQARSVESVADIFDMFQSPEAAQLSEEEHFAW